MKKLLPLMAIVLLQLSACKKTDNSAAITATNNDNGWVLAGVTYKTLIGVRTTTSGGTTTSLFSFLDGNPSGGAKVNSAAVSFVTAPTVSGTYQLVGVGQAKTATQCELSAGTTGSLAYAYIGTSTDVTVTVTNGKVKIVVPEVTLKCTTTQPDAKFSGTLQEM